MIGFRDGPDLTDLYYGVGLALPEVIQWLIQASLWTTVGCEMTERLAENQILRCDTWEAAKEALRVSLGSARSIFRGQKSTTPSDLISSLDRICCNFPCDSPFKWEEFFLQQFERREHYYISGESSPRNRLERLALMQHHGAATRLLDFTRSPWIAAFFAVEAQEQDTESEVRVINLDWCWDEAWLRIHDAHPELDLEGPAMPRYDLGNPSKANALFERLKTRSSEVVLPLEPFKMNERLSIQQGLFLYLLHYEKGILDILLSYDNSDKKFNLRKIVISWEARHQAMSELWEMNINSASLFPGIDGFCRSLKHMPFSLVAEERERIMVRTGLRAMNKVPVQDTRQSMSREPDD